MVGYSCPDCNGLGYEKVITIRGGEVKETKDDCRHCFGSGGFTNGRPNVHFDAGVTDPSWEKWLK